MLDVAYSSGKSENDALLSTAKRYRLNTEKIQKAVAPEFADKRKKQERKANAAKKAAA